MAESLRAMGLMNVVLGALGLVATGVGTFKWFTSRPLVLRPGEWSGRSTPLGMMFVNPKYPNVAVWVRGNTITITNAAGDVIGVGMVSGGRFTVGAAPKMLPPARGPPAGARAARGGRSPSRIPDNEIIVIGSNNKPGNFKLRPGVDDKPIAGVTAPGKSGSIAKNLDIRTEIPQMFGRAAKRGDTLSGAFAGDIRAAGFDVVRAPTAKNPLHVRIIAGKRGFAGEGLEWISAAFDRLARVRR